MLYPFGHGLSYTTFEYSEKKELKAFHKLFLQPGESQEVLFNISTRQLGFVDKRNQFVVEPGLFKVWIGTDSSEGLEETLHVIEG